MHNQPAAAQKSTTIGTLTILFLLLLPIEGILRKWILNDIQQFLVAIRDPILICTYGYYIFRYKTKVSSWVVAYFMIAGLFVLHVSALTVINNTPFIVMIIGIRAYVLYIPLGFILGDSLSEEDLRKIFLILLYIAIPTALLVLLQFSAPVESPINKGTDDDIESRFIVIAGIVRPYGPFTFVQAQNHFTAMTLAVTLIVWEKRRQYKTSVTLLVAATFATFAMGALSGARTFFGLATLICAAYAVSIVTSRDSHRAAVRLAVLAMGLVCFVTIFVVVFPTSFSAMTERQAEAVSLEGSTLDRALGAFSISKQIATAPLFGYGAGSGSNAATVILDLEGFIYGENEWGRMINELGPPVGVLAILFRVVISLWLGWKCIETNRRTGDASALILFGFSGYMLLYAPTVGQNQNLSFCWLATGMTLSLCRSAIPDPRTSRISDTACQAIER